MANVLIDNVLLREPNLAVPTKKPVGNVEIDWEHPLTEGLEFTTLCRGIYDGSVDNNSQVIAVGGTPEQERGGIAFNSSSSEYIRFEDGNITQSYPITFFAVVYIPATFTSCRAISFADASNPDYYFQLTTTSSSNDVAYSHRGGSASSSVFISRGGVVKGGAINVIAGVSAASNDHKVYLNGELVGTNTNTQNVFDKTMDRLTVGAILDSTPSYGNGTVHCATVFNKALSPGEVANISRDPYQILIPA
jgi:hypothetical protein